MSDDVVTCRYSAILFQVCLNYAMDHIIPNLPLKEVFHVWFQYGTKCFHQGLIGACVQVLSAKFQVSVSVFFLLASRWGEGACRATPSECLPVTEKTVPEARPSFYVGVGAFHPVRTI